MKFFNSKLLLLGDGAVGKTSLVKQYIKGEFKGDYKPTIGVDVYSKEIKFNHQNEEVTLNLGIWDIAGQKQFEMFRKNFFKGAQAALVVFDYSRPETFSSLETIWIKDLINLSGNIPFIIIGNKIDLEKKINPSLVSALASHYNVSFIETSAINNTNVKDAFLTIASTILQRSFIQ
ncbi:MAG: GTP-binding protein [Candidatus Helarchaeota archaeon]